MSLSQSERDTVLTHLYEFCRRPNPSGFEDLVRAYVVEHLTASHFSVEVDTIGNVTAWRGVPTPEEGYPLLSFHMDSVTLWEPWNLWNLQKSQKTELTDTLHFWRTPVVEHGVMQSGGQFILGGDDKCGAAIALAVAAHTAIPLKIVASVQEETGCEGIACVAPSFFADVSYALVLDRRGRNDLVTSIHGQSLCEPAFVCMLIKAAVAINHQVRVVQGMLSDALHLGSWIDNVVNLSVGYYCPHSPSEYIVLADLLRAYCWVQSALNILPRPRPILVGCYCWSCGTVYTASQGASLRAPEYCPRCVALWRHDSPLVL